MEPTIQKPRRPWLAALLSLFGGPTGQVYAGRPRRGLVLWALGAVLLPVIAFAAVSFPVGRVGFIALMSCVFGFPIYMVVDAFRLAKRHRDEPLAGFQRWWVYLLVFIASGVSNNLVAHFLRSSVAEPFVVPSRAMSPTILPGDDILVDKIWCKPSQLRRNDIVVFRSEGPGSPLYIMRLVGLPGDRIEIVNEKVLLNGEEWSDPHGVIDPSEELFPQHANYGPLEISKDSFFVMGDHRRRSKDSRILGPIPLTDLHAKARVIYWSRERTFPDPWDTSKFETGSVRWSRIGKRLD